MTDHPEPTEVELSELKRAATAASPGPWNIREITEPGFRAPNDYGAIDFAIVDPDNLVPAIVWNSNRTDAEYIAAANPDAILSLISALEAARQEAAGMKAVVEAAQDYTELLSRDTTDLDDWEFYGVHEPDAKRARGRLFNAVRELETAAGTGDCSVRQGLWE